ncbi:MAG: DNA-processing protein DprA [Ectothiorhodospiraceae bacterium]
MPAAPETTPAADLAAWLRLWRAPGIGPRAFGEILRHFGDPGAFFGASSALRARSGIESRILEAAAGVSEDAAAPDLRWLEKDGNHVVTLADPAYPAQLRELPGAPPLLFVTGNPQALSTPQLGIVGSRNATSGGVANATDFAFHLARAGLAITSGLALGVDGAAHRGALDADGTTLAVMATGADRIYPARHRDLAREISADGALVTEFPVGTGVRREHFPRRNRLISGLSLGVLVVEASVRSGSLVTARHALEQDREVFAIPGSIHNPLARGCHALIRGGAKLVESTADILEELPPVELPEASPGTADAAEKGAATEPPALDGDYRAVLDALGHDPVPFDVLLQRTALTPETLSSMLLVLELKGIVAAVAGGRYARIGGQEG